MDYTGLGKRIRKERKAQHLTQEALAEKVGISLSFLGHIERGSRKASIETLVGIANTLGVSLDGLLSDSLTGNDEAQANDTASQRDLLREINRLIETNLEKWER